MEKQRLIDVLKFRPAKKWIFLERVASTRDGTHFQAISMKDKVDATSVTQLLKLMMSEQKKREFDHVIVVAKVIRWFLLDSEDAFRALVDGGLDKCLLVAIVELRKASVAGVNEHTPRLELLLSNISDMFEWDFFGARHHTQFIEEILTILTSCDDCDGSLFAEAACVLMSMCSTNISTVGSCLLKSKKCTRLLEKVLQNLPRAKGFYYEALLLELVYRLQRYGKKTKDKDMALICVMFTNAFPVQVAHALPDIHPKAFREETRRLLNEFNLSVGVIKSYSLVGLQVVGATEAKLVPAGWVDLGGLVLEIEVTVDVRDQPTSSTLKLPYKDIKEYKAKEKTNEIELSVNGAISLADVVEGIQDREWARVFNLQFLVRLETEAFSAVAGVLRQRLENLPSPKLVCIESNALKLELQPIVHGDGSRCDAEKIASSESHVAPSELNSIPFELQNDSRRAGETGKRTEKRLRDASEAYSQPPAQDTKQKLKRRKEDVFPFRTSTKKQTNRKLHPSDVDVMQRATLPSKCVKPITAPLDEDPKNGYDEYRPSSSTSRPRSARDEVSASRSRASTFHREDNVAMVVPDDHDMVRQCPTRQKESFSVIQSQQLRQLQSLVDDIVKTHDSFRQSNMASLCDSVVSDAGSLLKEILHEDHPFKHTNDKFAVHHSTRVAEMDHWKDLQQSMGDTIGRATSTEAPIIDSSKRVMAEVQQRIPSEWSKDLSRLQKKMRTQVNECIAKTKQKLTAIERTFNTDDLQMMQQMLQRI